MRLSLLSSLFLCLATISASPFPHLEISQDGTLDRQLYNRNVHVVLQEPIERAQKRADDHAAKVKRGEYKPPHHPKYRPTGTFVPPLETGSWDKLALLKRRMEDQSLEQKLDAHAARAVEVEEDKREAEVDAATPTGFETVIKRR